MNKKISRILGNIGIGLLGLLIIVVTFLEAPARVIIILLVLLASCTVLPKRWRKVLWSVVAVAFVGFIVWSIIPQQQEGWEPYIYDEELIELEAKYAIPDSENAAVIYSEILESYEPNQLSPDFFDANTIEQLRKTDWKSSDYPELAKWLEDKAEIIERITEVISLEKCYFKSLTDISSSKTTEVKSWAYLFLFKSLTDTSNLKTTSMTEIKLWLYIFLYSINNDMAEERIDQAIQKLIILSKLSDHLNQQPVVLDKTLGITIRAFVMHTIRRIVIEYNILNENLHSIEKLLDDIKFDWALNAEQIIEYERITAKRYLLRGMYLENTEGKIKLNRKSLGSQFPLKTRLDAYLKSRILSSIYFPSTPQKANEIIDDSFKMAESIFINDTKRFSEQKPIIKIPFRLNPKYFISRAVVYFSEVSMIRSIYKILPKFNSDLNGTKIVIVLRKYKDENGQWPQSLEQIQSLIDADILIDPINNSSYVYKLTDDSFMLYSKGANNIDDEGIRDSQSNADDWRIWPLTD